MRKISGVVSELDCNPRPSPFASPNSPCVRLQTLKARTFSSSCSGRVAGMQAGTT